MEKKDIKRHFFIKTNSSEEEIKITSITEVIKFFKKEENYKLPNFIREGLNKDCSYRIPIGNKIYHIKSELIKTLNNNKKEK